MSYSDSSSDLPPDDPITGQEERDFLRGAKRVFENAYPNPQRIECPGEKILKALARHKNPPNTEEVLSHITRCSPCFREHYQFVQEYRTRKRRLLFAAIGLLCAGVSLWVSFQHTRKQVHPGGNPEPIKVVKSISPTTSPAPSLGRDIEKIETKELVLDLRNYDVTRGPSQPRWKNLVLPRGHLKLTIYLPLGSEEGEYEIAIFKSKNFPLIQGKGTAKIQDYIAILHALLDTTSLTQGKFDLGIRNIQTGWSEYPLLIE